LTAKSKNDFKSAGGLAFLNQENEMVITPFQDSIETEKVFAKRLRSTLRLAEDLQDGKTLPPI
jgi:hypothetical protein